MIYLIKYENLETVRTATVVTSENTACAIVSREIFH